MNIKNIVIGVIGAAVLLVGGFFFGHSNTPLPAAPTQQFGSLTGPIINYPYFQVNGLTTYDVGRSLAASSTYCYTLSPASTSTVQYSQLRLDTSSSTATTLQFGYGTVLGTIATQIGTTYTVGASAQGFVQASTTPTNGATTVIPPSRYVQWINSATHAGATDGDTGTCQIELVAS